jgi:hypothetical protein
VNQPELATMERLTRDLAQAVAQGELDRALSLLEERRRALQGFAWPEEADPNFQEKVQTLRALEEKVLAFCRTWRDIVQERLNIFSTSHHLMKKYNPSLPSSQFINLKK